MDACPHFPSELISGQRLYPYIVLRYSTRIAPGQLVPVPQSSCTAIQPPKYHPSANIHQRQEYETSRTTEAYARVRCGNYRFRSIDARVIRSICNS